MIRLQSYVHDCYLAVEQGSDRFADATYREVSKATATNQHAYDR